MQGQFFNPDDEEMADTPSPEPLRKGYQPQPAAATGIAIKRDPAIGCSLLLIASLFWPIR